MAENKYPINHDWKEYYLALEGIRRSGICNMWGAADPLNQITRCGIERAQKILVSWIENYNELKNLYWPDNTGTNNEEENNMTIVNNTKKPEIKFISLSACPICGEHPEKVKESLEGPNGRGYRGCFTYEYKCECCKLLRGGEATDICISSEEANNLAKELWNDKVASTQRYLDRLYVPKVLVENDVI